MSDSQASRAQNVESITDKEGAPHASMICLLPLIHSATPSLSSSIEVCVPGPVWTERMMLAERGAKADMDVKVEQTKQQKASQETELGNVKQFAIAGLGHLLSDQAGVFPRQGSSISRAPKSF